MLEQLFGSKTRVRLLRLFLSNAETPYFVRELTRKLDAQINGVRNELDNLVEMGLVNVVDGADIPSLPDDNEPKRSAQQRKYYKLNTSATVFPELRALFLKSRILLEKDLVRQVSSAGDIHYMALTGYFTGDEHAQTDIIIVGSVQGTKLRALIAEFERESGREINYTLFSLEEFMYRRDLTDKFLFQILESKKLVVCDNIPERLRVTAL